MDEHDTAVPADEHLERIRAVTDADLAHLDAGHLLDVLLERVCALLDADTCAILLLDDAGTHLVATAARGIEDELRQGVRIPVGRGFAGRIAAEQQPVILDRVDETTVFNPVLYQRGIQSMLGVPLLVEGRVVGVLHVGTLSPRAFTSDDTELLQLVADRVAITAHAQRSENQRLATAALQRSLLPGRLPEVGGIEFAARYVPGSEEGVGGDWYDVIPLPSGRLFVVMGDVAGRGLRAAVVMGRLRSTLRAYALDVDDPAEVLSLVDRKLCYFEPGEMATILIAAVDLAQTTVQLCSAGHPPPVFVSPAGETSFAELTVDPPIGSGFWRQRRTTTVDLTPGSSLVLYTDGLIERRGASLDDRLQLLLEAVTAGDPEVVCTKIMSRLVASDEPPDDVALLVMRQTDDEADRVLELRVAARPSSLRPLRMALRRWLARAGATDEEIVDITLAVGEASSNAVEHAYGATPGIVELRVERSGDEIVARVRDAGRWRAPRGEGRGRGMQIMADTSDDVSLEQRPDGTEVVIRKVLGR